MHDPDASVRILRGGLIGCGYFAANHLHAWKMVEGAAIVAVCDRLPERAQDFSQRFDVAAAFTDAEQMVIDERLDFVDIVTTPPTHRELVELAAHNGIAAICQKPIAQSMTDARAMVEASKQAGIPLMIHENFRWQRPMRALKDAQSQIGELFFARISFRSGWDVYKSQPYLATDLKFIIADLGIHLLDLARYFCGEVSELYCHTRRINSNIRGEDTATIMLRCASQATCIVDCSYGSKPVEDLFPQTLVQLEGRLGSVTLGPNFEITSSWGVSAIASPAIHPWSTSPGFVVQDSIVPIQQHWVESLQSGQTPETSGEDNLKTFALVEAAYESAESGLPVKLTL